MKIGMRVAEYECHAEVVTNQEKNINKGKVKLQCYEGSLILMPEMGECFVVYLDFLTSHEFDEEEYVLRLFLDTGSVIIVSKLGTTFEEAKEIIESIMGKRYQRVMSYGQEVLPSFDPVTLLKLMQRIKNGRLMPWMQVKKIHEDLPEQLETIVFQQNETTSKTIAMLRKKFGEENFYVSMVLYQKPENRELVVKPWILFAIPQKNILLLTFPTEKSPQTFFAFRIIMQQGQPIDKLKAKILEIEESLHIFRFDISPLIKDKQELRRTRYRLAIRRLVFVRMLRKSYLGKVAIDSFDQMEPCIKSFSEKAVVQYTVPAPPVPIF